MAHFEINKEITFQEDVYMYKKVLSICLSIVLVFGIVTVFSSCGTAVSEGAKKYGYDHTDKENMISFISNYTKTQSDSISTKSETLLTSLGGDYSTYLENKSGVSTFLQEAGTIIDDIFMAYKYVCIDYCKLIAAEDFDYYDYEGSLESLTGATEKGFEGYCGNLEDAVEDVIKKCKYLIETAEDDVDYDELSDEADEIYEILSAGYDSLYEKVSDYYEYLYDLISEIYENFSEGKKDVDKIVENIKAHVIENTTEQTEKTTLSDNKETEPLTENSVAEADSVEELETAILKYVNDEIAVLNTEFTELIAEISTYNKYVKNIDDVEAFYEKVSNTSYSISVKLREYSIDYAELILDSDMSTDDMYDAFDDLYDCIYEDAADALYDGIYDGILKDLYDAFYDGVVSDGMDSTDYSSWYDTSSDAYELWYDTSSDCYENWYDMQSDVYGFWSDVKGEIYGNDISGAKEEITDFKEDVKKYRHN